MSHSLTSINTKESPFGTHRLTQYEYVNRTWMQWLFVLAFASSTFTAGVVFSDFIKRPFSSVSGIEAKPTDNFEMAVDLGPMHKSIGGDKKIYKYHSPYEDRFPDSKLPYWAKKVVPYNKDIPTNEQICFVHVGKAGGSSVGCSLGFSLHCSDGDDIVPGKLPTLTTHAFHRGVNDCADDAAYFLFVVRDPLARALSAFNYERPAENETEVGFRKREFYFDCPFWTLEEMTKKGLDKNSDEKTSNKCHMRALTALQGIRRYLVHWFFNYQYYLEFIPENANILVIRNSHIVDDWNSIETLLGGLENAMKPSSLLLNNAHNNNSSDMYLSEESTSVLCETLCNEIQEYKSILRRAQNLDDVQIRVTLEELQKSCPREATQEWCLQEKPDIYYKIEQRRGC